MTYTAESERTRTALAAARGELDAAREAAARNRCSCTPSRPRSGDRRGELSEPSRTLSLSGGVSTGAHLVILGAARRQLSTAGHRVVSAVADTKSFVEPLHSAHAAELRAEPHALNRELRADPHTLGADSLELRARRRTLSALSTPLGSRRVRAEYHVWRRGACGARGGACGARDVRRGRTR